MKRAVIGLAALAVLAGGAAGSYFFVKRYGEDLVRTQMNEIVADTAWVVDVQYGKVEVDPLARTATVADINVGWSDGSVRIDRAKFSRLDRDHDIPYHATIEIEGLTDNGLAAGLMAFCCAHGRPADLPILSSQRYDVLIDYDFDAGTRSLTLQDFRLTARDQATVEIKLDVTHLPEHIDLPAIQGRGLEALVEQAQALGTVLIRSASISYDDHSALNRIFDQLAARSGDIDARLTFLQQRDALETFYGQIGTDRMFEREVAAAALEMLRGKGRLELAARPVSPVPVARLLRLGDDEAGLITALNLHVGASGTRDLGRYAMTEAEERAVRAAPFIRNAQAALAGNGAAPKFDALRGFQQALTIDPVNGEATSGAREAIQKLVADGLKQEDSGKYFEPDGAVAIFRRTMQLAPDAAEPKQALQDVPPRIIADARKRAAAGLLIGRDGALTLLEDGLGFAPNNADISAARLGLVPQLTSLADAAMRDGRLLTAETGALALYQKALAITANDVAAAGGVTAVANALALSAEQQIASGDFGGAEKTMVMIASFRPGLSSLDTLRQKLAAAQAPKVPQIVTVYNWSAYIGEHANEDFAKATQIDVQYDVFDSNATLEAKLLAGNSGYDVVVPSGAFLGQQINAGIFRKLDKSKLPNLGNLDPFVMKASGAFDPGHEYSVPYFWGTIGFGYNIDEIRKRLPDAPVDSWRMVLDPEVVSKFRDCGVTLLDAPSDVLQSVLIYLGKDPHTEDPEDYAAAERTLAAIRPYIKYFHSSSYINDIANGEICLAVGWNGDFGIAQSRAEEAQNGVKLQYVIPKEGTLIWVDNLAVPSDAPHPDAAMAYINYLLDPKVAADNANYVHYASPNKAALDAGVIWSDDLDNPAIYPAADIMGRLAGDRPASASLDQLRARTWAEIKTGQ